MVTYNTIQTCGACGPHVVAALRTSQHILHRAVRRVPLTHLSFQVDTRTSCGVNVSLRCGKLNSTRYIRVSLTPKPIAQKRPRRAPRSFSVCATRGAVVAALRAILRRADAIRTQHHWAKMAVDCALTSTFCVCLRVRACAFVVVSVCACKLMTIAMTMTTICGRGRCFSCCKMHVRLSVGTNPILYLPPLQFVTNHVPFLCDRRLRVRVGQLQRG